MKSKLLNPIFLLSIILLLLNDFYLKFEYHNYLTGKLSDFAGLFAFPFFFSCFFPKRRKHIHIVTALLFIFWKSSYSQPLIDRIDIFLGFTLTRVVDFSDNMAIISILFSYYIFSKQSIEKQIRPALQYSVIVISLFAFIATSQPKHIHRYQYTNINKTYDLPFSKDEFVCRHNKLQTRYVKDMTEAFKDGSLIFDSLKYEYRWKDSNIVFTRLIKEEEKNSDTIWIEEKLFKYYITGDSILSQIRLLSLYLDWFSGSSRKKEEITIVDYSTITDTFEQNEINSEFEYFVLDRIKDISLDSVCSPKIK